MNWIKNYWSDYLSVIAIICSIIAICAALPSNRYTFGLDYIGVLVGILSLLVTVLIGWQIWSIISIDKKIAKEVDNAKSALMENIEKTREDLGISNTRAIAAVLYQTESASLKLSIALRDYNSAIVTLQDKLGYAISLNEQERLSEIARLIIDTRTIIIHNSEIYERSLDKSFLALAQSVLTRLSASDVQVPRLYEMMNDIQKRKAAIQ